MPMLLIAIASSDIEIRSPAVRRMSISRLGGNGLISAARSRRSSVVSPIAETTTTTSFPARLASAMRFATRLMPFASATELPPYFCTTSAMCLLPVADLRLSQRPVGSGVLAAHRIRRPSDVPHRIPLVDLVPAKLEYEKGNDGDEDDP